MPGILVVEDEAIVATDISSTLKSLGYQVIATTDNGEKALELAAKPGIDLVLMDILLKGKMDGIETAELIRERYHLPVVFLTAHNDAATLERARVTIPYGYILKPFEERELQVNIEMSLYRHSAEKRLKEQSVELEKAKRFESMGMMAGGIANELNNLLTVIMGYLWVIDSSELVPADMSESAREAEKAVKRGRILAKQLLTFARGGDPEKVTLELNGLILQNLAVLPNDGKIQTQLKLAAELWPVFADYDQLNQVLQSLLNHARKMMPNGGDLSITTENLNVQEQIEPERIPSGCYVRVTVGDTGKALPAEILPRIFEPFSAGRNDWRDGLDLALSYSIISRHEGYIQIESGAERGNNIKFYLPALP